MTTPNWVQPCPDLTEARRLHAAGMKLVKLHPYSKRPVGNGWNLSSVGQIDDDATGYGIPLVPNDLVSIDPDHAAAARAGLAAWGIDMDELMMGGVCTSSTRPGSGGRAAFRADPEDVCRWLTINGFDESGGGNTLLELRAKSPNLQDVVPGVIYAGKSGEQYTQSYVNDHRFDQAPAMPDEFLQLWQRLSTDDDLLREYTEKFINAVRAAGVTMPDGSLPTYRPPMGSGQQLPFQAKGVRVPFNEANTVESILERHGYTRHGRGKNERWAHPRATGAPAIRPIPGRDGLWQSDHGGDPLHGTFDAWAAHVQLDHLGNADTARAEWDAGSHARAAEMFRNIVESAEVPQAGAQPSAAPAKQGELDGVIQTLELATNIEQLPALVTAALTAIAPLPLIERDPWIQRIKDAVRSHGIKSGSIDKELQNIVKAQRPAGKFQRFDPYRYIYLAPRNEFYDTVAGMGIPPAGLNLKYAAECDNAARHIATETDHTLTQADALGWNPVDIHAPARDQVIYEDEGKRMVNTWRGFALSPQPGDITPWLQHVEYLIPDERERNVLLDWLATLFQRVGSKPGFAIIHTGTSGNGKDSLYTPLAMAMGSAAKEAKLAEVIEGWGDTLHQRKFLIISEVKKERDRNVSNEMKTVTAPTATGKRTLNLKGGAVITQVDCMGVLMMTNFDDGFTIEQSDRRYFVITSKVDPRSADYYQRLHEWYRTDNNAAKVMHYLVNRDISGFNHNALPFITDGARKMADASRYDYEQDLEDAINEGLPPFDKSVISANALEAYCSLHNIGGGRGGRKAAMERLGWGSYKAQKKVGGTNESIRFYAPGVSPELSAGELHDLYRQRMALSTPAAISAIRNPATSTAAPPPPPKI